MDKKLDFGVSVVLPAGGSGERFGEDLPKQYTLLLDQPLFLHTVAAFHQIPWVQHIVLVVHQNYITYVSQIVQEHGLENKVAVTTGCETRHRSIYAGVKQLKCAESDVVIIHDVVRPFVDTDLIYNIAVNAQTFGAAGVTRPLVSTVISEDDRNMLVQSLDRSQYRASEMPQGFRFHVIQEAYKKADENDFDFGTECLLLAMKHTGMKAKLISGPDSLWKVTYKKDLYAAEGILKEKLLSVQVRFSQSCHNSALLKTLTEKCRDRSIHILNSLDDHTVQANSFVIVNESYSSEAVIRHTEDVLRTFDKQDSGDVQYVLKLKPCIVHVFECAETYSDGQMDAMKEIMTLAKKNSAHCVLNAVFFKTGGEYTNLCETIVSLIWNKEKALSGQTLVV